MSNDQKPQPPQKSRPETISIKMLRFTVDEDIPGMGMENALAGRGPDSDPRIKHVINYEPWLRRHVVEWWENGKDRPTKVICFPESRIRSYEEWR